MSIPMLSTSISGARNINPWIPVVLWMGVIFFLSSLSVLPGSQIIWWDFIIKKTAHMIVFGILFLLIYRADNLGKNLESPRYWLAFVITFIYACFDEWHQSFVPGRSARVYDVGFDMLGATISYFVIRANSYRP